MYLSDSEVDQLAIYNAERARGLIHTDAWMLHMAALQRRYNKWLADLSGVRSEEEKT